MKLLPGYYLIPLVAFIPFFFLHLCRVMFKTTSHLSMIGQSWRVIFMLFFQACELCYIGCLHFWLNRIWNKEWRLPALPVNVAFLSLILLIFGFSTYDFENTRHNLQTILFSTLKAYVVGSGSGNYGVPLFQIPSSYGGNEKFMKVVTTTIYDAPAFWVVFIVFMTIYCSGGLWLCYRFRDLFFHAVYSPGEPAAQVEESDTGLIIQEKAFEASDRTGMSRGYRRLPNSNWQLSDLQWTPKHEFKNPLFVTFHVLGLVHLVAIWVFFFFPFDHRLALHTIRPFSYNLMVAMTHYESRLTPNYRKSFMSNIRSFLPKGRYWLDNRKNPDFPAVHGDLAAFCAYNNGAKECMGFQPTPSPTPLPQMPNVVLMLYESLTPSTYLIDDEFINEHASVEHDDPRYFVTDTPFWDRELMPNLREFQKQAVTFSGLASNGLPTFSGWHAVLTSSVPSQTFMNIIDGYPANVDDVPSFMRHEDYRTMFMSAQSFNFDGMRNWAYRRSAEEEALIRYKCQEGYGDMWRDPIQDMLMDRPVLRNCSTPEMKEKVAKLAAKLSHLEKPKWFDYLAVYHPNRRQAQVLGLDFDTLELHDWLADRIVGKQFQLHWQQQRDFLKRTNQSNKPLFSLFFDVESHIPYYGYDRPEYYDKIDPNIKLGTDLHKELRFKRVNSYADKYFIKNTLEYLKEHDPNTIVIITGDHATRDIPVRSKNSRVTDQVVYSADCVGGSSGPDSVFLTSGMIGYLGNDTTIKKALGLDTLAGKTVKIPADHFDLTYTIMETVSRLKGHAMPPTHKRSRNLIELTESVVETMKEKGNDAVVKMVDETGWQSVSVISIQMDYRNGTKFLRTHSSDVAGAHYYSNMSFPACLRRMDRDETPTGGPEAKAMTNDMYKFLAHENYLFKTNKMFHYQLRETECIKQGKCEFPARKVYKVNDFLFYFSIVAFPLCCSCIGFAVVGLTYLTDWLVGLRSKSDDLGLTGSEEDTLMEEVPDAQI